MWTCKLYLRVKRKKVCIRYVIFLLVKHVVRYEIKVQNSYLLHITMSIMKHSDSFRRLISTFDMDTRNGQGISTFDMDIRYAQNFFEHMICTNYMSLLALTAYLDTISTTSNLIKHLLTILQRDHLRTPSSNTNTNSRVYPQHVVVVVIVRGYADDILSSQIIYRCTTLFKTS